MIVTATLLQRCGVQATLRYKGYLIYYLTISAGISLAPHCSTRHLWLDPVEWWWLALLLGEASAIVYVAIKGHIYRKPLLARSQVFRRDMMSALALASAYLLSGVILNADRLLLLAFAGGTEVTIFYISTLLGKTVSLLTAPLDGVIIGYLTKHDVRVTRRFSKFPLRPSARASVVGGHYRSVLSVYLVLYPSLYDLAKPFFVIARWGQVFFFLGEMMLVVVLCRVGALPALHQHHLCSGLLCRGGTRVIFGGIWGIAVASWW